MRVKLLTEHHWSFQPLQEAAQARLSLFMSKCRIVGNHMSWLKLYINGIWRMGISNRKSYFQCLLHLFNTIRVNRMIILSDDSCAIQHSFNQVHD